MKKVNKPKKNKDRIIAICMLVFMFVMSIFGTIALFIGIDNCNSGRKFLKASAEETYTTYLSGTYHFTNTYIYDSGSESDLKYTNNKIYFNTGNYGYSNIQIKFTDILSSDWNTSENLNIYFQTVVSYKYRTVELRKILNSLPYYGISNHNYPVKLYLINRAITQVYNVNGHNVAITPVYGLALSDNSYEFNANSISTVIEKVQFFALFPDNSTGKPLEIIPNYNSSIAGVRELCYHNVEFTDSSGSVFYFGFIERNIYGLSSEDGQSASIVLKKYVVDSNINSVYNNGYKDGYKDGEQYSQSYAESVGRLQYNVGYQNGLKVAKQGDLSNLFLSISDAVVNIFDGAFNFDFLGFNVGGLLKTIITICIVITVIRLFTGKQNIGGD